MKRSSQVRLASVLALITIFAIPALPLLAQESLLAEPLEQFTVGDIFPKVVDERFLATGKEWQAGATNHATLANDRIAQAKEALSVKKKELSNLKKQLKNARKDKDFVQAGTLEGNIKAAEIVVDVLQRFKAISEAQMKLSEAWRDTGDAIIGFVDADQSFEAFRSLSITRPKLGETDQRLMPDGYRAFDKHTKSLAELGKAFAQLGDEMENLSSVRMKALDELDKGGHVVKK